VKIVYSFNKKSYEAARWYSEIEGASDAEYKFIPFNHDPYLEANKYTESFRLDGLYRLRDPRLMKMYSDLEKLIEECRADALIVTNCPPYHPDFLRKLQIYRALYSTDDPEATYKRTIPYLHAYQHVFYADPAYSPDMDMGEKMRYCGMVNADWLPISAFDFEFDPTRTGQTLLPGERDIEIIYIGAFWRAKLDLLAKVKKAFGKRFRQYGYFKPIHNVYMNLRYGNVGWVRPVSFQERVELYGRSKIGINVHWNEYGLGNQRLYHLPANGVMQICDCASHIGRVFEVGKEVVGYRGVDDLIDKVKYYLDHDEERQEIALRGFQRTMREYRFRDVVRRAARLLRDGMERVAWGR
jgi:glycosyltransferase involved in cell wall biosynthesis